MSTTLDDINLRAHALSTARNHLRTMTEALNAGLEALKMERMPDIRQAIDIASAAWGALEEDIRAHPELFVRPRTVAAHGITFGIEKGKGAIDIADPDRTVKLIRKHLPDQADVLIATKEAPVKKAVSRLPADVLKRIGVSVVGAQDTVVIRPAETDVDKLVKALVKAQVDDAAPADD